MSHVRFSNQSGQTVYVCVSSNGGEGETNYFELAPGSSDGWLRNSGPVCAFVSLNPSGANAKTTGGLQPGNTYTIGEDLKCD